MDSTDPRVERTRTTVLGTAAEIVVEQGPTALTVDAVVARSGVARSTIYRHWPTRDDLLSDVYRYCVPDLVQPPPELGFEEAVRFFLHDLVRQLGDPKWNRMMPAVLALKAYEPNLAVIEESREQIQAELTDELFARGRAEGLFSDAFDSNRAVAQLVGPLVFAVLTGETACDQELADQTLRCFMAGLADRHAASDTMRG